MRVSWRKYLITCGVIAAVLIFVTFFFVASIDRHSGSVHPAVRVSAKTVLRSCFWGKFAGGYWEDELLRQGELVAKHPLQARLDFYRVTLQYCDLANYRALLFIQVVGDDAEPLYQELLNFKRSQRFQGMAVDLRKNIEDWIDELLVVMQQKKAEQLNKILRGEDIDVDSGQQNAMRHTLLAAFTTNAAGNSFSRNALAARENNVPVDSDLTATIFQRWNSGIMAAGYRNKEIGYKIAAANPGSSRVDIVRAAIKEFRDNGLWVLKKTPQGFVVSREKISQKQHDDYVRALQNINWNK